MTAGGTVNQVEKGKSLMDKNVWGDPCFLNNAVNLGETKYVIVKPFMLHK